MSNTETRDEAIRRFSMFPQKSWEDARLVDKYLQSLPTGRSSYYWTDTGLSNNQTYFIH